MLGVAIDREGMSDGLALLWRKDVKVDLLSYSKNHIDAIIHQPEGTTDFRITRFYGASLAYQRHKSWQLLRNLSTSF